MPETSSLPPVTLLCGFLGAGKTTLLNHLLTQAHGRRWAVVVNDVAAINIDGSVVRAGADTRATRDVVELGNGCVCCSSKDELAETVFELGASTLFDHILVETTGVAEPRAIGQLLVQRNGFGRSLSDVVSLSALVSVIDAAFFLKKWREYQGWKERGIVGGRERPVFELMLEQAECCDVLVLNKCDLASGAELAHLEEIARSLNPRAEIERAEHAQLDANFLLGTPRFDAVGTLRAASWLNALTALLPATVANVVNVAPVNRFVLKTPLSRTVPTHEEKYGIRSVTYQARQPFEQRKLYALIETGLPGLLRAKGYFWIKEQPDEMGFLSVAGGVVRYDFLSYWWAALVENGRVSLAQRPELVQALWAEPHGDRRQELVFIGVGLDESAVHAALEACLTAGAHSAF